MRRSCRISWSASRAACPWALRGWAAPHRTARATFFIAFSTANPGAAAETGATALTWLPNGDLTPLFDATVEATEEAIVNALVAADTMTGVNGNTAYALPLDQMQALLKKYGRLAP